LDGNFAHGEFLLLRWLAFPAAIRLQIPGHISALEGCLKNVRHIVDKRHGAPRPYLHVWVLYAAGGEADFVEDAGHGLSGATSWPRASWYRDRFDIQAAKELQDLKPSR
jgi:hypothetical protein